MACLFDTDAVSEFVRPRPAAAFLTWAAGLPDGDQYACPIVIGELLAGARRVADGARYETFYRREVFPRLRIVDVDETTAGVYADLRVALEREGLPLQDNDLWIASCAMRYDLELVTGNIRHFERLQAHGLRLCRVLAEARFRP